MTKEKPWQERFDDEFVRYDGLMDKYHTVAGDTLTMAEAVKAFIAKELAAGTDDRTSFDADVLEGRLQERSQVMKDAMAFLKLKCGSSSTDTLEQLCEKKGYTTALTDIVEELKVRTVDDAQNLEKF